MTDASLFIIFATGLLTGGLTCLAVQGGLLATAIARDEADRLAAREGHGERGGNALPIAAFLAAKLAAYTVLGFLLGWLGSALQLSLLVQVILQFAVAIFMIGTALNLLNVHPAFRYFAIQPPHFLTRMVRRHSKAGHAFAPAVLGAFTVFIPCGTTQAMMALAIASGDPLRGAAILFAFILGTAPLFFILGYLASKLGDALHKTFMKVAAVAILLLALYGLDGTLAVAGSPVTIRGALGSARCVIATCPLIEEIPLWRSVNDSAASLAADGTSTILIGANGYRPRIVTVKAGERVDLRLVNEDGYSCAQAFTIPSLGIQKVVSPGSTETVSFTAPREPGEIPFMCSMGMYRGTIRVIAP